MKNFIYTIFFTLFVFCANAQWTYEKVDNGFDDAYKVSYSETNNSGYLKLEDYKGQIFFYISGNYFCDEYPNVDLVFVVNGENQKFSISGTKSENSKMIFLSVDLMNSNMLQAFKSCSTLKIRINETYCDTEVYTFNMSKSTSALNFMQGK